MKKKLEYILYSILFVIAVFAFTYTSFAEGNFDCSSAGIKPKIQLSDGPGTSDSPYRYYKSNGDKHSGEEWGLYYSYFSVDTTAGEKIAAYCYESQKARAKDKQIDSCRLVTGSAGWTGGLAYIARNVGAGINTASGSEYIKISMAIRFLAVANNIMDGTLERGYSDGEPTFKNTMEYILANKGKYSATKETADKAKAEGKYNILFGSTADAQATIEGAAELFWGAYNSKTEGGTSSLVKGKTDQEKYELPEDGNLSGVGITIEGLSEKAVIKPEDIELVESDNWSLGDNSSASGNKVSLDTLTFKGDTKDATNPTVQIKYEDASAEGGQIVDLVTGSETQNLITFKGNGVIEVEINIGEKDPEECEDKCEYEGTCCGNGNPPTKPNSVTLKYNNTTDWTNILCNKDCDHDKHCDYKEVDHKNDLEVTWRYNHNEFYYEICKEEIKVYFPTLTDGYAGQNVMLEQLKYDGIDTDTISKAEQTCNLRFDQEKYNNFTDKTEKAQKEYVDKIKETKWGYKGKVTSKDGFNHTDGILAMGDDKRDDNSLIVFAETDTKNSTYAEKNVPDGEKGYNKQKPNPSEYGINYPNVSEAKADYNQLKSDREAVNTALSKINAVVKEKQEIVNGILKQIDDCKLPCSCGGAGPNSSPEEQAAAAEACSACEEQCDKKYKDELDAATKELEKAQAEQSKAATATSTYLNAVNPYIALVDYLKARMDIMAEFYTPMPQEQKQTEAAWAEPKDLKELYSITMDPDAYYEIKVKKSDGSISSYTGEVDFTVDMGEPKLTTTCSKNVPPAHQRKKNGVEKNCEKSTLEVQKRAIIYEDITIKPKSDIVPIIPGSGVTDPTYGKIAPPRDSVAIPANAVPGEYKYTFHLVVKNDITGKEGEVACDGKFVISGEGNVCYNKNGGVIDIDSVCGKIDDIKTLADYEAYYKCYQQYCGCNAYCTYNGGAIDLDKISRGKNMGPYCDLSTEDKAYLRSINCTVCVYGDKNVIGLGPNERVDPNECYYCIDRNNNQHKCYSGETKEECYLRACVSQGEPLSKTFDYKNISPNDPFPNGIDPNGENMGNDAGTGLGRYVGENWVSKKGFGSRKEIEKSGDTVYDDDDLLQYSYSINAQQMANIRAYNRQREDNKLGGFNDFNLDCGNYISTIKDPSGNIVESSTNVYYCESRFLSPAVNNDNQYYTDNLANKKRTWVAWCNEVDKKAPYCTAWKLGELR